MRTLWTFVGIGLVSAAAACGGSSDDADENGDFGALEDDAESELRGRSLTIPSGGSKSFTFRSENGGPVHIQVDCGVSSNPDVVGNVFKVESSALDLPSNETPKAAYFEWAGEVQAGSHTVTLSSVEGGGRCTVKVGRASGGSCSSFKTYRSPNTNATHIPVGEQADNWESFPASGNHWGAWAPFNQAYATPVKRGFALHNMEHGGAVLSYKCPSNESEECRDAEAKLKNFVEEHNFSRYLITPDPDQPTKFAIRTWRMVHTSDCFQSSAAKAFYSRNIRNGREDIDADPPIPFDPTTTNVPCQNLMAAPDSCY